MPSAPDLHRFGDASYGPFVPFSGHRSLAAIFSARRNPHVAERLLAPCPLSRAELSLLRDAIWPLKADEPETMEVARKRSVSPSRTRHYKRMILLDEEKDDWRRTASPSTSSVTSKTSSDSEAIGAELHLVTEQFSGFLADFLAEFEPPKPTPTPTPEADARSDPAQPIPSIEARALPPSECRLPVSLVPGSQRSDSQDFAEDHDYTSEHDEEDESTVAEDESEWEDDEADTPGSPGSDVELHESFLRRGTNVTVLLTGHDRTIPCAAKVLAVHDRRGKFTMRLSKSSRRAVRAWHTASRSPGATRSRFASPRP